jgi:hypothetical protein
VAVRNFQIADGSEISSGSWAFWTEVAKRERCNEWLVRRPEGWQINATTRNLAALT